MEKALIRIFEGLLVGCLICGFILAVEALWKRL